MNHCCPVCGYGAGCYPCNCQKDAAQEKDSGAISAQQAPALQDDPKPCLDCPGEACANFPDECSRCKHGTLCFAEIKDNIKCD